MSSFLARVCCAALIACNCGAIPPAWSDWYFRGTPNAWGCSAMREAGGGTFTIRAAFAGEQQPARFKLDRACDWRDSAPPQDYHVEDFASYDISFNPATRQITLAKLSAQEWVLRGTFNNWSALPLTRRGDARYEAKGVVFAGADPRFKVDRFGDWRESYPAQDYRVSAGTYDIVFDAAARRITLQAVGETWYFRGTPNNWAATPMLRTMAGWELRAVEFGAGSGCRFKADRYADWRDSFPAQDYVVACGKRYDIRFFDNPRRLEVVEVVSNQAPVIRVSAAPGAYRSPQQVTIDVSDDSDPSPSVRYSLDGSEPSIAYARGTVLSIADTVASGPDARLRVRATDSQGASSGFSGDYTIDTTAPPAKGRPLGGDFREDTIYFVLTARYYDGDPSNNRGGSQHEKSGNAKYDDPMFRGDFKGLIAKLDYIKALGFSAIWITPVVLNRSDYDYHGYHGYDFNQVDKRLESPGATYQDLIDAAHAKGIKVVQDVVYNHTSRFGARGLHTVKYFGIEDAQWDWYYDSYNPSFTYDGLSIEPISGKAHYNGDLWSVQQPPGVDCPNWGKPTNGSSPEGYRLYYCQWPGLLQPEISGLFPYPLFHKGWLKNWEDQTAQTGTIHEDLPDLNTENKAVQDYLIGAYNRYIDMGVDAFRIDTAKHISRNTFNRRFIPAAKERAIAMHGDKGKDFFMFGEVGSFVHEVWNKGVAPLSAPFYTWKERAAYSADDEQAANEAWTFELNQGTANRPTSDSALLRGNDYHAPDTSRASGMAVIDMAMHMNFGDAGGAFNKRWDDPAYHDATWNVVYVDSHDYGPNKSSSRYAGGTEAWAENMSLMWTFRGIPTLLYGSEIEFKKGVTLDCGPSCPLDTTGRAYFGAHLEGSVVAADFGEVASASGPVATTLAQPLARHVQRLNQIRRAVPALQKGQYSTEGVSGALAFKRRYTDAATDSFAVVTISGGAAFSGIPNGIYKDVVTGEARTVGGGSLTVELSGKGNLRVFVLDTAKTPAPGKIGSDGPYLH